MSTTTIQELLNLKAACRLHILGIKSKYPLTKIGHGLGFKSKTIKGILDEVNQELLKHKKYVQLVSKEEPMKSLNEELNFLERN